MPGPGHGGLLSRGDETHVDPLIGRTADLAFGTQEASPPTIARNPLVLDIHGRYCVELERAALGLRGGGARFEVQVLS